MACASGLGVQGLRFERHNLHQGGYQAMHVRTHAGAGSLTHSYVKTSV